MLTGGGDAPGLNAVIRAVVKGVANRQGETLGITDGFAGLLEPARTRRLCPRDTVGILRRGGTILGATNRANPFAIATAEGGTEDRSAQVVAAFHRLGLDALIAAGGDGTVAIAHQFQQRGVPIVVVPKTIDNDIPETVSFGFDTAVAFATDAIDRLHTTADSHHRVMVVEVMGRYSGWIALHAGIAGGADVILMPEIPFDISMVAAQITARETLGAGFNIVVAAEGARPIGGGYTVAQRATAGTAERLGGIGAEIALQIERLTGKETRAIVLAHLQRGGIPTACDRLLATRLGAHAVEMAFAGQFGSMVASQGSEIRALPLERVVGRTKTVPTGCDLLEVARAMGIVFGN